MIDQVIYDMLTESTGTNPMDSGNDEDRNWQINQKRTLEDFQQDPHYKITFDKWGYIEAELSVFHHFTKSLRYDAEETQRFGDWYEGDKERLNKEGVYSWSYNIPEVYLEEVHEQKKEVEVTENIPYCDNNFTQAFYWLSFRDSHEPETVKVFISIHNGADVMGGYTDYKVFTLHDVEEFNTLLVPYVEEIEWEMSLKGEALKEYYEDETPLSERLDEYGVPDSITVIDERQAEEVEE